MSSFIQPLYEKHKTSRGAEFTGKSALSYEPNAKGSLAYLALAGELIGKTEEQYIGAANE